MFIEGDANCTRPHSICVEIELRARVKEVRLGQLGKMKMETADFLILSKMNSTRALIAANASITPFYVFI